MKVKIKRQEVDRLAKLFLKTIVENKEDFILKGIKASKEFKEFVANYVQSKTPLLFDSDDDSICIETEGYKKAREDYKKKFMIPAIADYVGDDFQVEKELLDSFGNLKQ